MVTMVTKVLGGYFCYLLVKMMKEENEAAVVNTCCLALSNVLLNIYGYLNKLMLRIQSSYKEKFVDIVWIEVCV